MRDLPCEQPFVLWAFKAGCTRMKDVCLRKMRAKLIHWRLWFCQLWKKYFATACHLSELYMVWCWFILHVMSVEQEDAKNINVSIAAISLTKKVLAYQDTTPCRAHSVNWEWRVGVPAFIPYSSRRHEFRTAAVECDFLETNLRSHSNHFTFSCHSLAVHTPHSEILAN